MGIIPVDNGDILWYFSSFVALCDSAATTSMGIYPLFDSGSGWSRTIDMSSWLQAAQDNGVLYKKHAFGRVFAFRGSYFCARRFSQMNLVVSESPLVYNGVV